MLLVVSVGSDGELEVETLSTGITFSVPASTIAEMGWSDLTGVTVDLMPPVRPESESGYFELFEGPSRDAHAKHGFGCSGLIGDVDDVLLFTTRSEGQPFVGRFGAGTIESPVAEVAWFCRPSTVQPLDGMTLFTLYRRQKLVMPYVGRPPFDGTNSTGTASFDPNFHDLSVRLEGTRLAGREPVADLVAEFVAAPLVGGTDGHGGAPPALVGVTIGADEVPSLIDELPLLACVAARAAGETRVTGAGELRVKESDRIRLGVENLRAVGADATELPDGFVIRGSDRPLAGTVRTAGDHRIAMAFGVLGAVPGNAIVVDDPSCVAVSWPSFWDALDACHR
jgi:hypothetical protein